MEPVNIIGLILILGLELFVVGHEEKSNSIKYVGASLTVIGWILNVVAVIMK